MKASRKYPTIAYTIISVLLLIGLLSGIGWITNFSNHTKKNIQIIGSNKMITNKYDLDESQRNFNFNSLLGRVTIKSTDSKPYIKISSKYKMEFEITTKNDVCTVDLIDNNVTKIIPNLINDKTIEIEVYLPDDIIDNLDIEVNAGKLDITNIKANNLNMDIAASDVKIKDCDFVNFKTDLSAGNLNFYANKGIKSIESSVSAGNMNLYLPKNIDGFKCAYETSAGDFKNKTDFKVTKSQSDDVITKSGDITYGDQSCNIILDVSVGNIDMLDY